MHAPDPERLAAALARAIGPATIERLHRVSGGASRETWLFDAVATDATVQRLVLRRDPGPSLGSTERATEYHLLRAAYDAGVPAPRVRLLLDVGDDLGEGFVMDHVDGETIARRILRDDAYEHARPKLATQCGTIAAAIHATPVESLPALAVETASHQLDQWTEILDTFGEPHPAFEFGLRWMRRNVPETGGPPRLVHGDFRNGNFVVGSDGIRSVLDWELAHLGDPIEDLGWLCARAWRFGVPRVVGGFGDVEPLLDAYERAGGVRPTLAALKFWVALATLKWGAMCLIQAFTHLNRVVRSVELATIGRRVVENEWDLLRLIAAGEHPDEW